MVQGKQRSANVQAPSSAVQQACRGAPARRQLRSGMGLEHDGTPPEGMLIKRTFASIPWY
eukprot:scaffold7545_cov42-Phaeocystis_antarctica.AAC.2